MGGAGLLPSACMDSHDTLADGRPSLGLVWLKPRLGLCGTVMLWLSSLQIGRREPVVCFTFVLPPEIPSEQRVLGLEISLCVPAVGCSRMRVF